MPPSLESAKPVRRTALSDHVFDEILALLIDGRLAADTSLNIDGLARQLDVSPTPVREALARLEATGMVRRVALRGYFVAPEPSAQELADLMDARLVVEPATAYYACGRGGDQLVADLEQAINDLRAAPNGPTYAEFREYWTADERFHQLIAAAARNSYLLAAFNGIGGAVQRFRQFAGTGVTDKDLAIREHTDVLDAIRAGDPDAARNKMRLHLEGVRERATSES